MFDSNYSDSIIEAAKKALTAKQKALDVDKDGEIEASDLAALRNKKEEACCEKCGKSPCECDKVEEEKGPCWKGYKQLGMKKKDGKEVPNCVPESTEELEEAFGPQRSLDAIFPMIERIQKMSAMNSVLGKHLTANHGAGYKKDLNKINNMLDDLYSMFEELEMVISDSVSEGVVPDAKPQDHMTKSDKDKLGSVAAMMAKERANRLKKLAKDARMKK